MIWSSLARRAAQLVDGFAHSSLRSDRQPLGPMGCGVSKPGYGVQSKPALGTAAATMALGHGGGPKGDSVTMSKPAYETAWTQLTPELKSAAVKLGYGKEGTKWDADGLTRIRMKSWAELTGEQRDAAKTLGYDEKSWTPEALSAEQAIDAAGGVNSLDLTKIRAPKGPVAKPQLPPPPAPTVPCSALDKEAAAKIEAGTLFGPLDVNTANLTREVVFSGMAKIEDIKDLYRKMLTEDGLKFSAAAHEALLEISPCDWSELKMTGPLKDIQSRMLMMTLDEIWCKKPITVEKDSGADIENLPIWFDVVQNDFRRGATFESFWEPLKDPLLMTPELVEPLRKLLAMTHPDAPDNKIYRAIFVLFQMTVQKYDADSLLRMPFAPPTVMKNVPEIVELALALTNKVMTNHSKCEDLRIKEAEAKHAEAATRDANRFQMYLGSKLAALTMEAQPLVKEFGRTVKTYMEKLAQFRMAEDAYMKAFSRVEIEEDEETGEEVAKYKPGEQDQLVALRKQCFTPLLDALIVGDVLISLDAAIGPVAKKAEVLAAEGKDCKEAVAAVAQIDFPELDALLKQLGLWKEANGQGGMFGIRSKNRAKHEGYRQLLQRELWNVTSENDFGKMLDESHPNCYHPDKLTWFYPRRHEKYVYAEENNVCIVYGCEIEELRDPAAC